VDQMVDHMAKPYSFVDRSGATVPEMEQWEPVVIPKQAILREVERLCDVARPDNGWRSSLIVHPSAVAPGLGLAPGIDVTINVLLPGETAAPIRRNATGVEICNAGTGIAMIGGREIRFEQWDVWNTPSMRVCSYRNDGTEPCVRLTYSNAPLLQKLMAYFIEENPPRSLRDGSAAAQKSDAPTRGSAPNFQITDEGAWMRGYEYLVDIEVIANKALHWPWKIVRQHVTQAEGDNQRALMALYNPATERRNGATHGFFATIGAGAPNTPERPVGRGHRHASAAINYYFLGGPGRSIVDGQVYDWDEGDLMLSAPSWSEHAHYFPKSDRPRAALTIQDHPLHIGMESLIWQENMDGDILTLGAEAGVTGYTGPREKA
jgi:gentisate 1,2-dioxygenase